MKCGPPEEDDVEITGDEGGSKTEEQVDHGKVRSRREGRGYGVNSPSLSRYTEIDQSVLLSLVIWRFVMDR
jgi:hypothetical protein